MRSSGRRLVCLQSDRRSCIWHRRPNQLAWPLRAKHSGEPGPSPQNRTHELPTEPQCSLPARRVPSCNPVGILAPRGDGDERGFMYHERAFVVGGSQDESSHTGRGTRRRRRAGWS